MCSCWLLASGTGRAAGAAATRDVAANSTNSADLMNCIVCRTFGRESFGKIVGMCVEGGDENPKMKYHSYIFATGNLRSKINSRSHVILCEPII